MARKSSELKSGVPHRSPGAGSNGFKADPARARQAGERGGATTRDRYGPEFFREVGARGGLATREKLGRDHFVAIGRKGGLRKKRKPETALLTL